MLLFLFHLDPVDLHSSVAAIYQKNFLILLLLISQFIRARTSSCKISLAFFKQI